MRLKNESGEETDDSDSYKYPHSMVSRMTGGTVRPGPGYNTGTLKSSLSGFSAHNSQTERDQSLEMTMFSEHPLHSLTIWRCLEHEQIWAFEQ